MAASRSNCAPGRLLAGVLLFLAVSGCAKSTSWVDELMTAATAPEEELPGDVADFLSQSETWGEPGGCLASISDGPVTAETDPNDPTPAVTRGTGNDPYTATGARQVPGPDMFRYTPPEEPVDRVVGRPADPNEHDPAGMAEGGPTGPMPEPRILGSPTPTTLPEMPGAELHVDPVEQCG